MPQVFMIVAPKVQPLFTESVFHELSGILIGTVEGVFGLVGKEDVTFTAVPAMYVQGDADVQVEIRFTAGKDEYGRGEPFEPTEEQMQLLADSICVVLSMRAPKGIMSISVWVIPYHGTVWKVDMDLGAAKA